MSVRYGNTLLDQNFNDAFIAMQVKTHLFGRLLVTSISCRLSACARATFTQRGRTTAVRSGVPIHVVRMHANMAITYIYKRSGLANSFHTRSDHRVSFTDIY